MSTEDSEKGEEPESYYFQVTQTYKQIAGKAIDALFPGRKIKGVALKSHRWDGLGTYTKELFLKKVSISNSTRSGNAKKRKKADVPKSGNAKKPKKADVPKQSMEKKRYVHFTLRIRYASQ